MELVPVIIAAVVGLGAGAGVVFAYDKKNENGGKNRADDLVRKAKNEASDIILKARKEAADLAEKSKNEEDNRRKDWKQTEKRLSERELSLDNKFDQIEKRPSVSLAKKRKSKSLNLKSIAFAISNRKNSKKLLAFQKLMRKKNLSP